MPQRPGTDNTASAQTLGDVVAEMRFMRGLHMPAELLRKIAPNHPFATQAARTQRAAPSFLFRLSPRAQGRL